MNCKELAEFEPKSARAVHIIFRTGTGANPIRLVLGLHWYAVYKLADRQFSSQKIATWTAYQNLLIRKPRHAALTSRKPKPPKPNWKREFGFGSITQIRSVFWLWLPGLLIATKLWERMQAALRHSRLGSKLNHKADKIALATQSISLSTVGEI